MEEIKDYNMTVSAYDNLYMELQNRLNKANENIASYDQKIHELNELIKKNNVFRDEAVNERDMLSHMLKVIEREVNNINIMKNCYGMGDDDEE